MSAPIPPRPIGAAEGDWHEVTDDAISLFGIKTRSESCGYDALLRDDIRRAGVETELCSSLAVCASASNSEESAHLDAYGGAKVVAPPDKTATIGGELSRNRDRAVRRIRKVGRRQWKTEVGYHRQARAENAFFRLKTILGDRMRSRGGDAQRVEAVIACNTLDRMTELGDRSPTRSAGENRILLAQLLSR